VTRPDGSTDIQFVTMDAPRADEVVVRIVATGICHTDVANFTGSRVPKPVVLGHEGAGVVEAIGSAVTAVAPGDPVILSSSSCGRCSACLAGMPARCRNSAAMAFGARRLDGSCGLHAGQEPIGSHFFSQSSFGAYALTYERSCVPAPADVALELLGPLACGIQTGAGAVLNTLKLGPRDTLGVLGVGAVGLAAVMAGALAGVHRILAIDVHGNRLELARELGATDILSAGAPEDLVSRIRAVFPDGLDAVVDTSGHIESLRVILGALGSGGRLALISSAKGAEAPFKPIDLVMGSRQIVGIAGGGAPARAFIPELIGYYRSGRFPFDRLVTFYPFSELRQAVADLESGKTIKPVLRM